MDIRNFLQSGYKKENFIEFISHKFHGFEENDLDYELPYTESEQKNIQKYKFLGQVELDDKKEIGFFEFQSTEKVDIENNRVSLNTIMKKKVEDELLDGAIAIFYNPLKPDIWRLSFIRFSYDENDKQQVSNLKRYTYVLGKDIAVNTAYAQLKELKYPSINELQEAFGVEKVSKEFFKQYKELYFNICDYLQPQIAYYENEKNIKLFTKKLLGRIVFLYFLEKKGWLGSDEDWKNGDKRFLTKCFNNKCGKYIEYENYYADILQPIFFEALNEKRENDYFSKLKCKMPFLNGGLFSRDEFDNKDIIIEDYVFKNIFETFDSYNFTIIEDSPNDSEVAIDPEMLGRVFEDLLEDRKDKGAFYTPREIVHYMCQQSIINYLLNYFSDKQEIEELVLKQITDTKYIRNNAKEIQNKLYHIKVLDPAIGSGAYPMGMLHEIVSILSNIDKTADIAKLKRQVIENSIYGVDIEQSAVEIAKLRFWLSIVVDEDNSSPLPNLFYKIMVGNSLLETINGFDPLKQHGNKNEIKFLKDKFHRYFNASNNLEKGQIDQEIRRNIQTVLSSAIKNFDTQPKLEMNKKEQKEYEDNFEKHTILRKIIQDYSKYNATTELFLYKVYFKEVIDNGGFDVVIGNPPYVRQEKIKELKPKLQIEKYRSYNGTADLYIYFFEKGFNLLKENGILSYITSNKYTKTKYGKDFRKFILENAKILEYIDFSGKQVFESATVDTSILTYKKSKKDIGSFLYCDVSKGYKKDKELYTFIEKNSFNYLQIDLNIQSFDFLTPSALRVKKHIEEKGIVLKEWDIEVKSGIKTGFNEAFIIDGKKKDELIEEDSKSAEIIKPLLRGRDIKKYDYKFADKWIIATELHSNEYLEKEYPVIFRHLSYYKEKLSKRGQCTNRDGKGQHHWLELDNNPTQKYFNEFKKEKILWIELSDLGKFTLDTKKFYVEMTIFFIVGKNLKYLLALLNSKLVFWYFDIVCAESGVGTNRWKKTYVNQLPILQIKKEQQKPFEILVDYILFAKEQDMKNEASLFESIIDNMVYDLYFEEDMKKADCYISDEVISVVKEFDNTKDIIQVMYKLFKNNKIIQRGLIYRRTVSVVKIIEGEN